MLTFLRIGKVEFVVLMAALMATVALSIDAVLPALGFMANDFGTSGSEIQLIITVLFVGFVLGQIIFGPLSDRFGRLPSIYAGIVLFILGCLITITAQSLELALLGRFIQGIGVSGPRIMVSALVRDCYSGRSMARIMSFVATIFMIVPILAPMLGQAMLWLGPWQVIFAMYIVIAIILCLWVRLRLDETLLVENRNSIQIKSLWHSFVGILTNRASCVYTIVSGFIFGGFLGYISSSQWLFQEIYQVGEAFPIYFSALVLPNLVSSLINAKLVVKWGMFRLVQVTNVLVFFGSLSLYFYAESYNGIPPLMHTMAFLFIIFSGIGFQFGNLNALAMEPLGRAAGIGASFVGAGSTLISIPIGGLIGMSLSTNIFPLAIGMALCSLLSILMMHWVRFGFSLPKASAEFKL
ncbi:MAG: multidrug effflux MFS transporter [Gammaproteobacteria bacterium]|nr:multidrug effflux MFS transporter [Gammaproteobacteria bacterium]